MHDPQEPKFALCLLLASRQCVRQTCSGFPAYTILRTRRLRPPFRVNRRAFLQSTLATGLGAVGVARLAAAERDFTGQRPTRYPDPDIVALEPRFAK
jgi:hypothetical protein